MLTGASLYVLSFLLIIISYFIGNVSPSILLSQKLAGKDIRELGSGNAGTTNVLRNFGKQAAATTLLIDACKGIPSVLLGNWIGGENLALLCGFAVIVGHIWPVIYGLKGGKGVATTLGVAIVLAPWNTLWCVIVGLLLMILFRRVSLGSLVGILVFPISAVILHQSIFMILWGIAVTLIIWYKHRENIRRLLQGREPRIHFKK